MTSVEWFGYLYSLSLGHTIYALSDCNSWVYITPFFCADVTCDSPERTGERAKFITFKSELGEERSVWNNTCSVRPLHEAVVETGGR